MLRLLISIWKGREMQQTLRERNSAIWSTSTTEEEYQKALKGVVQEARGIGRIVRQARETGHQIADENIQSGVVRDEYREHALIDFLTGLIENEALEIKTGA